jgi:hypothetical protein
MVDGQFWSAGPVKSAAELSGMAGGRMFMVSQYSSCAR